ncbi:hypothetical protein SK128_013392, partial [Halocaridina rubra]
DVELTPNKSARVMMSGNNLVLQDLQRTSTGTYRCFAANSQGNATSNPVPLTVRRKLLLFCVAWTHMEYCTTLNHILHQFGIHTMRTQ